MATKERESPPSPPKTKEDQETTDARIIAQSVFPAIMSLIRCMVKAPSGHVERYDLCVPKTRGSGTLVVVQEMFRSMGISRLAEVEFKLGEATSDDMELVTFILTKKEEGT